MEIEFKLGKDVKKEDVILSSFEHLLTPMKLVSIGKFDGEGYRVEYERLDGWDNTQHRSYMWPNQMVCVCVDIDLSKK